MKQLYFSVLLLLYYCPAQLFAMLGHTTITYLIEQECSLEELLFHAISAGDYMGVTILLEALQARNIAIARKTLSKNFSG